MNARWLLISVIWLLTAIGAVLTIALIPREHALEWFGALLAGSVASVSLVHLLKARPAGFVQELIYVGGGAYLILALASVYLFVRG
jgi:predicted membrane channel-forming protein YqfA (hemolysin III family)